MAPEADPPPLPLEVYAQVLSELSQGADFEQLLATHGLDEETWEQAESYWDSRIDAEELPDDDNPTVPPLLATLAGALQHAQARAAAPELNFEQYLELMIALRGVDNPVDWLHRRAIQLEKFLDAQRYWLSRIATDPELRERYLEAQR